MTFDVVQTQVTHYLVQNHSPFDAIQIQLKLATAKSQLILIAVQTQPLYVVQS